MARNVFISILGISCYKKANYYFDKDKKNYYSTEFIQEAVVKYFTEYKNIKFDKIFTFLTKDARKLNWNNPAQSTNKRCENYTGLSEALKDYPIIDIPILDGNTERELWDIFDAIFKTLEESDELYIDITHSFRSLPVFLTVLLNYAKTLKDVKVKAITYGNWEAKDDDNFAPVIDLTAVNELQNWTNAVNEFVKFGYATDLSNLMKSELNFLSRTEENRTNNLMKLKKIATNLHKFTENIYAVRGKNIVTNSEGENIYKHLEDVQSEILPAFEPLITKLKEKFYTFRFDNDLCNGFHATKWCINNNLIQQGITILKETITGITCEICNLDYKIEKNRNLVDTVLAIKNRNIVLKEQEWNDFAIQNKDEILRIFEYEIIGIIYKKFDELSQLRNDINHAGFKQTARGANKFESSLENLLLFFIENFINCNKQHQ